VTESHTWEQLAAQAEEEAAAHPLKSVYELRVEGAIARARERLGGDGVENHAVTFNPTKWERVSDALPDHCRASGRVTRGDLFSVAAERDGEHARWRLFVASNVWGYGPWGYGPSRVARIERITPKGSIDRLLDEALTAGAEDGPMAAYHVLRGGHPGPVAAKYWGSAFFTKALYAGLRQRGGERPALILDQVLATRVTELSELPHLLYRGNGYNWSTYRYGVYLAWMGQTAERFGASPEFLEYSLFKA
jgi:hypothetical protein